MKGFIPGCRSAIIVLGLTFKENCADLRNSQVYKMASDLEEYGCDVFVHDPIASTEEAFKEYGIQFIPWHQLPYQVDAIVFSVPHKEYLEKDVGEILSRLKRGGVVIGVKPILNCQETTNYDCTVWRL